MIAALAAVALAATASPVVDRTFLCSVNVHAGARFIDVGASPKMEFPEAPASPPRGHVSGGGSTVESAMVSINGGGPPTGGVFVNKRRCTWLRKERIPLSPAGLPGPPIRWSAGYRCLAPQRILVRVRASLRRPASWVSGSRNIAVRGEVIEASLAVQTSPTRKKLAFVALTRTGESKLYVAPRCES